jgi:hypothetical protein
MVEFGIRGTIMNNKISVDNFFASMNIQYSYPLPNGYLTCGPSRFNILT